MVAHWVYVVLSRVKTLKGLILNQKLDEDRSYEANRELVRWEERMKKKTEFKTFRDRGNVDVKRYLDEEEKYNQLFSASKDNEKEIKNDNRLDEVENKSVIEQNANNLSLQGSINNKNIKTATRNTSQICTMNEKKSKGIKVEG